MVISHGATTSGSGSFNSLVNTTYRIDASGDATLNALSGTLTVANNHHYFDNPVRTDLFDADSGEWDATGTREMRSGYNSSSRIVVSGAENTTAGGMPLSATRSIDVGQKSSGRQEISQTLQLKPVDDIASPADSDRYEWVIITGDRESESGTDSTVRLNTTLTTEKSPRRTNNESNTSSMTQLSAGSVRTSNHKHCERFANFFK